MSKNKLRKFSEMMHFTNVYQNFEYKQPQLIASGHREVEMAGTWRRDHFQNDHPLTLELACGRGEYTVALAERFPERNFIGMDIKGARMYRGARKALDRKLENAAFLRTRIELIDRFFALGEIDEIWITFPDPFLKKSKVNRRLTSPHFMGLFKKIMKNNGVIHLKTDSPQLYEFTLETAAQLDSLELLEHSEDIYAGALPIPELEILTYYEKMHLEAGKTIKYVRMALSTEAETKATLPPTLEA